MACATRDLRTYEELTEFENRLVDRLAAGLARRYRLPHQDREDARQEFAIRLWEKRDCYDPDRVPAISYEAFITRYLEMCSLDILRSLRPDSQVCGMDPADRSAPPAGAPSSNSRFSVEASAFLRILITSIFQNLSPDQQTIIVELDRGNTIPEIAGKLGHPYKTVHARVQTLRGNLREQGLSL